MDPGVNISERSTARLWDDPTKYITVRMTFDPGVGDTPDDYYVLWIDPEALLLAGCSYVVTYTSLLPEGVEQTPEHILIFDGYTEADGLRVPTGYKIYEADRTLYGVCEVDNWSFSKPFDETRMTMPTGAVIDDSQP
jgi:hypothetical protein